MELKNKKLFLFDIDGTVSVGNTFIDGAKEFLEYISQTGRKYIFITNNSTKSVSDYILKFRNMGLETTDENFVTASTAAVKYIRNKYKERKIYTIGTKSFVKELKKGGINAVESFEKDTACVLVGFDNELTYEKIETACHILSTTNADYAATNPDLVCPAPFGFIPDCGSICRMINEAVKKEPVFIGKPESLIADMCLENTGLSREETLVVGDRLYTDILLGVKNGIDTAAVLTGETDAQEIKLSSYKPDYVFNSVKDLFNAIKY